MTHSIDSEKHVTIGLDVGDRTTHLCALDSSREVLARSSFPTTREGVRGGLSDWPGSAVFLEAGSQSPWMSAALRSSGHRVHVVDPRRVSLISKDHRKTDKRDAELLARLGSAMPELLGSVHHRGEQAQADLSVVRVRDHLVRMRTQCIQQARGLLKAFGVRVPGATSRGFHCKAAVVVPELLRPALDPLLSLIGSLCERLDALDAELERLANARYPEVTWLRQVGGVGPVTAVAYALTVEDPTRFRDSRCVGSWVGLAPRSHASGDRDPALGISKAGDGYLRRLLVQCSQYILGPFGKDSDLRRFGQRLIARGGRGARRRAVTAVARKLAVLLHRLWVTQAEYEPLRQAQRQAADSTPA